MDNEMIERCKAELQRCFAPAIDFKAPYAKVMSDMAIKEIIKAMRKPTDEMLVAMETAAPQLECLLPKESSPSYMAGYW